MKIKKYLIIIFCCLSLHFAKAQNSKFLECDIFLEPLVGFNISFNESKDIILRNFDEQEKISSADGFEIYKAQKKISFLNNRDVLIDAVLKFKNCSLILIDLNIPIGENNSDFKIIKNLLKKDDVLKINNYIYLEEKTIYFSKSDFCVKSFSLNRSWAENNLFDINIKHSLRD